MTPSLRHGRLFLAGLALLIGSGTALAIIQALLPLEAIINDSVYIALARVEKVDATQPLVVLTVQDDLKGKPPFRRLAVHFKGDADAKKLGHTPQLLKRLATDLPVVLFFDQRGKNYTSFAYTNGTWFQLLGQQTGDKGQVSWSLTHGEPFLRRTFKGTTAELMQLVKDAVAGKGKLPGVNKKEKPGFGPEVSPKSERGALAPWLRYQGANAPRSGGALFGVIPTIGVGAPLMVLAALFPAVFGGVLLLFRQWIAFITVFSCNSTLLLVHWLLNSYWPGVLRDSWLGTDAGLWFLMTLVAVAGTVWAWQRQLARPAQDEAPRSTELRVLWVLAVVFVVASVATPLSSTLFAKHYDMTTDLASVSMGVLTLGVLAGAIHRTAREYRPVATPLATEGVMIAGILLGQVGYTAYRWSGDELGVPADPAVTVTGVGRAVGGPGVPRFERIRWQFAPERFTGVILAAPLVHGDEVWVGAARTSYRQGTLYCLNRADGTKKGEFIGKDGDLKQMISSPVLVDGRLYMGEGFHDDPRCRLFCVDPKERRELWAFPTGSQTEPAPCVAGGKVYFGAGNDGIYCVEAATGTQVWRYPPQPGVRLLRCGSSPAVAGQRLFAGSAVDRNQTQDKGETAIFCLDTATGKEQWKKPVPLPAWAGPVVANSQVIYALGNGDVLDDAENEKPAGLVLSVEPATGTEQWRFDVPNGVLDRPAVDGEQVYFGCRDGQVYCLGRHDGKLRWKHDMGAPVVAAPVLAHCPGYAQTAHVFAVSSAGKVVCLEPSGGLTAWELPLTSKTAHFTATPRVSVTRTETGDRRQLIVAGAIGEVGAGRPIVFCLEDFVRAE